MTLGEIGIWPGPRRQTAPSECRCGGNRSRE